MLSLKNKSNVDIKIMDSNLRHVKSLNIIRNLKGPADVLPTDNSLHSHYTSLTFYLSV